MATNLPSGGLTDDYTEAAHDTEESGLSGSIADDTTRTVGHLRETEGGDTDNRLVKMNDEPAEISRTSLDACDSVRASSVKSLKKTTGNCSGSKVVRTSAEKEQEDADEREDNSHEREIVSLECLTEEEGSCSGKRPVRTIFGKHEMEVDPVNESSSTDESNENTIAIETSKEFTQSLTNTACRTFADSNQMDVIASFAKESRYCLAPFSPSVGCGVGRLYVMPSMKPGAESPKRPESDISENYRQLHNDSPDSNCGSYTSAISECRQPESSSVSTLPLVTHESSVTRIVILDSEKNADISEIVTGAIERAQDGFPDSAVQVVVHLVNINNISCRSLTSECHITIAALNPGHEMDPPPVDIQLARDLELDSPQPVIYRGGPATLNDLEVYDSRYNKVSPGSIICLDQGLYTHFAVYLGAGMIAHSVQDGVTCEKLFEAVGSGSFTRVDHLDRLYRPEPIRDVILRAICRVGDASFVDSAAFATWCRYGRPVPFGNHSESNNLPFLLGLQV